MSNGKPWTEDDTATLVRMNAAGHTDAEIGEKTGHAAITVFYRRDALGLPRAKPPCGSNIKLPHIATSTDPSEITNGSSTDRRRSAADRCERTAASCRR